MLYKKNKFSLSRILMALGARKFFNWMPDSLYLRMIFRVKFGYSLNLKNPQTFSEKLQWLKLYDRNPLYTELVDKYEVRKYIAETIGEEYLIPLLGVWDNVDEIDFAKLPNQFVLKNTHDSGSIVICKDKDSFDIKKAKKRLRKYLKRNPYWATREWPYKNIKPRIIAEEYKVDESKVELKDYKIFCFNGEPKYMQVDFDRYKDHKRNIYDENWDFLDFEIKYPNDKMENISRPRKYEEILLLARKLSANIPHVRVDFYYIENKEFTYILFGELTFYHGSGLEIFKPKEWDKKFGDLLELGVT